MVDPGGLPAGDLAGNAGWVDCRADDTVSGGADDAGLLAALLERVRTECGLTTSRMLMAGGCAANLGGACNRGRVIPAEATRDRWLQITGPTGVSPSQTAIDGDRSDAGPANRFDDAGAIPLQWWRLDGAGHVTPGRSVPVGPNPATGIRNRDIGFAEAAWSFFGARLRDAASGAPTVREIRIDRGGDR